MASNLVAMASNRVAMASNLVAMAFNLLAMASYSKAFPLGFITISQRPAMASSQICLTGELFCKRCQRNTNKQAEDLTVVQRKHTFGSRKGLYKPRPKGFLVASFLFSREIELKVSRSNSNITRKWDKALHASTILVLSFALALESKVGCTAGSQVSCTLSLPLFPLLPPFPFPALPARKGRISAESW